MNLGRKKLGFTLVEIMIVVLIIGLLLAIAVPNFVHSRTSSRLQAVLANLKQIDTAKQQFANDQQLVAGSAINDATDLVPHYLSQWPTGPVTGDTYSANGLGMDPTMNGQSASVLQSACGTNSGSLEAVACPF